jgi:hypothetical protein
MLKKAPGEAINYLNLSFPLVGNLSFETAKRDDGQADMTSGVIVR